MRNKKFVSLFAGLITLFSIGTLPNAKVMASDFGNEKSFNDRIIMGDNWILLAGAEREYPDREYLGVRLTNLTSLDGSDSYTYMKARIVNANDVLLTSNQTIAKSNTAIYQFDLLVSTSDNVYLSAKGNQPTLDARATGIFYLWKLKYFYYELKILLKRQSSKFTLLLCQNYMMQKNKTLSGGLL